ncbi:MAG: sialate O-acetylesterase [Pseudobacter sp.]|uniref:sialate O-acetylesterase n=1 Tax=Pseudobacter sp. TaxID=2045420 RepID=UPI003F8097A2
MRIRIALSLLILIFVMAGLPAFSKVRLPSIWGNNMVLQQNSQVIIRGTAKPNARLFFTASWNAGKSGMVQTGSNGQFEIRLQTPNGSGKKFTVCFDDGEKLCLSDILIGDVWFCSGQSNMEMPVKGFRGQPVHGSLDAIITAKNNRKIRLFTVRDAWSTKPLSDGIEGKWTTAGPEDVAGFSAVGYFFANKLDQSLDIPIAVIDCSWSMSKIEAWMSQEMLATFPAIKMPDPEQKEFGWAAGTPTLLYNAMVHPWQGFPIKGMLWYQGEANTPDPLLYKKLFPEMLKGYRVLFNNDTMPFYFVQLAPFGSENRDSLDWARFRQVQLQLSGELRNIGMAHTSDLGDEVFIHPPQKKEVGERLALWALANTYGLKGFCPTGPVFGSATIKEDAVEISFKYGEDGLNPENAMLEGFEIAGADGNFVPAKARILNASPVVKVWNENIKTPVRVRYCFRNYRKGNLVNNYGLPAAPFEWNVTF